jgi:predicted HD phosphohydrolase
VGAAQLEAWFGPAVARPVALHVMAKRRLAVAPGYAAALSRASTISLAAQGGPFTAKEARRFDRLAFAEDALRLRRFDDEAKVIGLKVGVLLDHAPLLERLARG